ncbi:UDP-Glycosyltransferase superfamily protein [Hibiscus syriacus]|uniref:UDP-Glycosyltransferase superfamily protein n=1 Tax=Hibiscus syriacus TaxID=106335 RepID=A0A6A3CPW7_HIBSY|nr:UDP-Glycosyltransferase superfamily protein [Hibiscus syriacus]
MDSLSRQPHFLLFPFMAQGHLIPMVDIARLLAQRNVTVTVVTTPHNAGRVRKTITRAVELGHPIRLVELQFPGKEFGLEDGVENVDMISSMEQVFKFFTAANSPEDNVQWTCCFCYLCVHAIKSSNILDTITSDSEPFTVPGLTEKIEFTKLQLPANYESWKDVFDLIHEADQASYGVVLNSFEELESPFVEEYRKITKAWCIGPVSLNHKDESDKAERGNKASINEQQCLKWLDSKEQSSVIYACLGSAFPPRPVVDIATLGRPVHERELVVQVLKIGVSVGADTPTTWGVEKSGSGEERSCSNRNRGTDE